MNRLWSLLGYMSANITKLNGKLISMRSSVYINYVVADGVRTNKDDVNFQCNRTFDILFFSDYLTVSASDRKDNNDERASIWLRRAFKRVM